MEYQTETRDTYTYEKTLFNAIYKTTEAVRIFRNVCMRLP